MTWKKPHSSTSHSPYYHGTTKKCELAIRSEGFKQSEGTRNLCGFIPYTVNSKAFFFSDMKHIARLWAANRSMKDSDIAIIEADLNLKKTFDMTDNHFMEWEGIEILADMVESTDNGRSYSRIIPDQEFWHAGIDVDNLEMLPADDYGRDTWKLLDNGKIVDKLIELGYDSVIVHESDDYGGRSIAVLDPSAIKILEAKP